MQPRHGQVSKPIRKVPNTSECRYARRLPAASLRDMERLAFGPFVLDFARNTLLRDGRRVPANHKGMRLLAALLRTPGEVVDKAALMDAAWPGMAVEESNLSVQIAALRKLLGAAHDGSDWSQRYRASDTASLALFRARMARMRASMLPTPAPDCGDSVWHSQRRAG